MNVPMIKLPTYELTLPSTQEKIDYRPYTVKEEKLLIMAMQSGDQKEIERAMFDVVKTCTFDKVDASQSPFFDIQYIFLKLRCKSVGELSEVVLTCAGCTNKINHIINLDEITVKIPENHQKIIDFDTFKVEMRYPILKDIVNLKDNGLDVVFDVIVASIKNIFNDEEVIENTEETRELISAIVENMLPDQFLQLQEFFETVPALLHSINYTCDECQVENNVDVSGIYNFFL